MIKLGTSDMAKAYVGSTEVSKMYFGNGLVYSKGSEVLPYDAQLFYLESTGTQYIDLGIYFDSTKVYKLYVGHFANTTTGYRVFGARSQAGPFPKSSYLSYGNSDKITFFGSNTMTSESATYNSPNIGTGMHTIEICCYPTKRFIVDGSSYNTPSMENAVFQSEYTLALFTENTAGTYAPKSCRFGRLEIYDPTTGVYEHDYIPVRVGQTGYLYDRITGTLKGNSGTGEFVLGSDVSVMPYDAEVEYLQSSGTQYINLPMNVKSDTFFELDMYFIPIYNDTSRYSIFSSNPFQQFESKFYSMNSTTYYIMYDSTIGTLNSLGGWGGTEGNYTHYILSTSGKTNNAGTYIALSRPLTANITAFRLFGGYHDSNRYPVKFHKMKITAGTTVLFDLKSVRVGQVGYMYDSISGELFGNNGTGNFILGNDIV